MTLTNDQCDRISTILGYPDPDTSYDWVVEYAEGKYALTWRERFEAVKLILNE